MTIESGKSLSRDKFFTRYKEMYKTFFPFLLVVALQGIITVAVNLTDNLMLGNYSETAMAGASMVNQIHFLLQMIVGGLGAGVVVIGAQY